MSAIDILIRVATGQAVTPQEAQTALHSDCAGTDRTARVRARNRALLEAAEALALDNPCTWILAQRLERAIQRFSTRVWPLLRAGAHRGELSPADAALYRAFLTGARVPRTQRRLYDLLLT